MQVDHGLRVAREKTLHRLFQIGICIKGADGLIEVGCGILLLSVSLASLNRHLIIFSQHEIRHDVGDLLADVLRHAAHHMTANSKRIAGAYLLGNGIVKVFLAAAILRGKLWCYPVAIAIISIFVLAQFARLGFHFSYTMLAATVIDIAIVLLIWREYSRIRRPGHVC